MRRLAPIALSIALLGAGIATAANHGGQGGSGGGSGGQKLRDVVRVATSGSYSERIKKLPITRHAGKEKRVVMSLGPKRLPRLRRGDRLKLSSEVQVTLNCNEPMKRCIGPPYHYDPEVAVRLLLARSADSVRGLRVSATKRAECRQRHPREHHCVLVFTDAGLRVRNPGRIPCPPDRCFVNLVIDASNRHAGKKDVLIVGGNKPDGSIPQDRGRINAVLLHPGNGDYPKPHRTRSRVTPELPLDLRRHVVYSQRLRDLEAGQQLAVEAEAVTDRSGLPYSVRTSSELILAERRNATEPGPLARRLGGGGEISEANGFNCTADRDTCTTRKVGVLRVSRSAPRPLFVNLVMVVGPKRLEADPGDRYDVLRRGGLAVTRYAKPKPRHRRGG